jgi:phenylacetate-CoA ligase
MRTFEFLSSHEITRIQSEFLVETVQYAYEKSLHYKNRFDDLGLSPLDIKSIEDLTKLPLTDREDIQRDNRAFFAAPRQSIAELVSTTGTTGDPAFIALTGSDLDRLAGNEEKSFGYAGVIKGDVVHLAVTCDNLFIAGIAYYRGLIKLGASVVRIGPQNIIRHLDLMKRLKPEGIVAVPSFMVHMARRMQEYGINAEELGLKKIILIGDSIRDGDLKSNALGKLIETSFGNICYSTYGITEAQLSFCECSSREGLHSHADLVLVEVVDDNGVPLPDGEIGELVLTPLQLKGMPLIRYRTGDITFKISGQCSCGRNSARIGPIMGRKRHKLKVKGVTLYPKNIENALLGIREIINYQIEAYTGDDETDNIVLRIGAHTNSDNFLTELYDLLRAKARVTPVVEIESPESIDKRLFEGGGRKALTFKDMRRKMYE